MIKLCVKFVADFQAFDFINVYFYVKKYFFKDTVWNLNYMSNTRPWFVQLALITKPQLISMHQLHLCKE